MMEIGVASPSAHGQAMMSTDTATTNPWAKVGGGPNTAHTLKATTAIAITVGTTGRDLIRELLTRCASAARVADQLYDLREQRLSADFLPVPCRPT